MLTITAVLCVAVFVFFCTFAYVYHETAAQLTQSALTDSFQAMEVCADEISASFLREWNLLTNAKFVSKTRKMLLEADGSVNTPSCYSRLLDLQEELESRFNRNDIFGNAALLYLTDGSDYLCSAKYISDDFRRDYENGLYHFGDMEYDAFINMLEGSARQRYVRRITDCARLDVRYADGYAANAGFFVYRYSEIGAQVRVYAFMQVNLDRMRDAFSSIHYAGDDFMLKDGDADVFSSDPSIALRPGRHDGEFEDGKTETRYLSVLIDKVGLTGVLSLDQSVIYAGINRFYSVLTTLAYTFLLLMTFLVAMLFLRWHYPVIQIAKQLPGAEGATAISRINSHIADLEALNSSYQDRIDRLELPAQEMLLSRMYAGLPLSEDDQMLVCKFANLPAQGAVRCICIGCLNQPVLSRELYSEIARSACECFQDLTAAAQFGDVYTALIVQKNEAYDRSQEFYELLNHLLQMLNERFAGRHAFAIGISDAYTGYESIPAAQREAFSGWIDALTWQNSSVVHSDSGLRASNQYSVGYDQLDSMYQALNAGDCDTAAMIFDKLVAANFQMQSDVHLKQLFCQQYYYDIVGVLVRLSKHYDILPVLESLLSRSRHEGIAEQLSILRGTLFKCVDLIPVKDDDSDLSHQLQAYCADCLADPLTSTLSAVADHFGITESTLSKFFKAHIGVNFSVYMENMRIRRAEKLLAEGKLTVRAVSAAIGYQNVTTFYNAFKRNHNCTPTQWLEHYHATNAASEDAPNEAG